MPSGLDRRYGLEGLHFITFSCYRRLPLLGAPCARDLFVGALRVTRERYGFSLVGYVVMPEHVHLLLVEGGKGTPSDVLKALKYCVFRDLRAPGKVADGRQRSLAFSKYGEELPHFWKPRFYGFNVFTSRKKKEKLIYMHENPVAGGLVNHPGLWPWSSYWFYEKGQAGLIAIDPVG